MRPFARWMMPGNDALYHGEVVRIKGVWSSNGERQFGCQARNGVVILASDDDIQEITAALSDLPSPTRDEKDS